MNFDIVYNEESSLTKEDFTSSLLRELSTFILLNYFSNSTTTTSIINPRKIYSSLTKNLPVRQRGYLSKIVQTSLKSKVLLAALQSGIMLPMLYGQPWSIVSSWFGLVVPVRPGKLSLIRCWQYESDSGLWLWLEWNTGRKKWPQLPLDFHSSTMENEAT